MSGRVMIYGAAGFSGRALARRLSGLGYDIVLAGRSAGALDELAHETGSPSRCFGLTSPAEIHASLPDIGVVLNAAGPFALTAAPMMTACIRRGVHYLDLTGEWPVFDLARTLGGRAREAGVMLMPGVGYLVVLSDCLFARAARETRELRALRSAYSAPPFASRGSARTLVSLSSPHVVVRHEGTILEISAGSRRRRFNFGAGERLSVAVSGPDVMTADHTTGVANVETYFEAPLATRLVQAGGALAARLYGMDSVQRTLAPLVDRWPSEPGFALRADARQSIVVEAEDAWRRLTRWGLHSLDGYTVTTATAEAVLRRVVGGGGRPGFQTPAGCFGPNLIDDIDSVWPFDASPFGAAGATSA